MSIKCGHCKSHHADVATVRACATAGPAYRGPEAFDFADPRDEMGPLATPGDAHREWHRNTGVPMGTPGCPQDACHPVEEPEPTLSVEPSEGVFLHGGDYYKVQQNLSGTAYYVKKALVEDGGVTWSYEGRGPLYFLTENARVTGEQAARFGEVTGMCVFCGRRLTDERSISVGYGPVCAEKNSLPWGEAA